MSAFRYCEDCEHPLEKPTPREDLFDGQNCPSCGALQSRYMSEAEWIVDLWENKE